MILMRLYTAAKDEMKWAPWLHDFQSLLMRLMTFLPMHVGGWRSFERHLFISTSMPLKSSNLNIDWSTCSWRMRLAKKKLRVLETTMPNRSYNKNINYYPYFPNCNIFNPRRCAMQACAQQLMATPAPSSMAQPCTRKCVVAHASNSFASRTSKPQSALSHIPAAKPFGAASLPRRDALRMVQAAQAEGLGKLISKVEIPAFIPRSDLMDQLSRWAVIEIQENGMANVGCPCKVCI